MFASSLIIQPQFFDRAVEMREEFEARVRPDRRASRDRLVWDYWYVEGQYAYVRTLARHFFSPALYRSFLAAPLPEAVVIAALRLLQNGHGFAAVYTHGAWGEYGHRHHRDVSLAVHRVFGDKTWSLAGPLEAELSLPLSRDQLDAKRQLAQSAYQSQSFAGSWCSDRELLVRLSPDVAEFLISHANEASTLALPATLSRNVVREMAAWFRAAVEGTGPPPSEAEHIPEAVWKPAYRRFVTALESIPGVVPSSP